MKTITTAYRVSVLWISVFLSLVSQAQTVLDSENFEGGNFPFALWNDGGSNCFLDTNSRLSGSNSINLQARTSTSQTYTNDLNLTAYGSIEIEFDFRTSNYSSGEGFFIEFSNNGGATWDATLIAHYVRG